MLIASKRWSLMMLLVIVFLGGCADAPPEPANSAGTNANAADADVPPAQSSGNPNEP